MESNSMNLTGIEQEFNRNLTGIEIEIYSTSKPRRVASASLLQFTPRASQNGMISSYLELS